MKSLQQRREWVYTLLSGIFIGTLVMINILGLGRFMDFSFHFGNATLPILLPLGVLPYPITFLCTNLISEFYGQRPAQNMVYVGLLVNLWVLLLIWLAGYLPPQNSYSTLLPESSHPEYAFYYMRMLTLGSIIGSMTAYTISQLLDVLIFNYVKKRTAGKHLWLRNNLSTLLSQFIDTLIVIGFAYYYTGGFSQSFFIVVFSSYFCKVILSLIGTLFFYVAVSLLKRYFTSTASILLAEKSV